MVYVIDLTSFAIATIFLIKSVKKIITGKFSILHVLLVLTYLMQILPIVIVDISNINIYDIYRYTNIYKPLLDTKVSMIYDFIMVVIIILFYYLANKNSSYIYFNMINSVLNIHVNKYIMAIMKILMFATLFAVIISPEPSIYLKFSYFYTNKYDVNSNIYLFHMTKYVYAKYISFASILIVYLCKDKYSFKNNLLEYIAAFFLMWTDGKRTIIMFLLLGILCIDILKRTYKSKIIIGKTVIFLLLIVIYFNVYSNITGKGEDSVFISNYIYYYSRISCVKTSIYSRVYNMKMLDYDGQSILYDIGFFIPRSIWGNKPLMFVKYFTSFSCGYGHNTILNNFNLQVNIWAEWIANFGIIGIFFACLFIVCVARITEKKNNAYSYMFGLLFSGMYLMFGFEPNVQIVFLIWIFTLIFGKRKYNL